jgi:CRP-like cAMP-binding protein
MTEEISTAKTLSENFVSLPKEELEVLASIFKRKEFRKGEFLLKEGDVSKDIFFVQSGLLRQFYFKDGRDITEHFGCENQGALCIVSLFKQVPTTLIVGALENSVVYLIPYAKLITIAENYRNLAVLLRKILESSLIISQDKADSWRFETARERYNRFLVEFPEAAKRASVNHIASYLLMTPESLSRVRAGVL